MASSGSLLTNGWYSSSKGDYVYLEFAWAVTATSIPNNTKTIYWELRGKRTASGYVKSGGFKVIIDGDTVYSKSTDYRIELRNGTVVASGSKTLTHKADGTRSFDVYIEGGINTYAVNCKGSKSFDLDTIPRASSISCTTADIESKPTITISRASSSFTHTITYKFGSLTGTIATKTSSTSITSWTIPADFYKQIPNAKTGEGTLTCTTYSGTTQIGDPTTCKLSVTTDKAKCEPTVSGSVVDKNASTIALTGNKSTLVRYKSTALCTLSVTLNKSAGSIKTKTINNVALSGNTITLEIPNVENNVFEFYAKDSREYSNTDKETPTLVPYVKLTNNATAQRTDPTSGNATLKFEGNYFKGNFGAADNTLTVKYRQGSSGDYTTVTPTISNNNTYSATVSLTGLEYTKAFEYEVVVEDKLESITKKVTLQKGIPVFDWGENDFRFNVPVYMASGLPLISFQASYISHDIDTIQDSGTYRVGRDTPNFPIADGGTLVVFGYPGACTIQVAFNFNANNILLRSNWYGTWYDWRRITLSNA